MGRTITTVAWTIVLGFLLAGVARGQHCAVEVSGLNKDRKVFGPVSVECGGVHSGPFGNWGVTSNHGDREDKHQFQGWCRNLYCTLDALNFCTNHCIADWYQWNSCTTGDAWPPGHREFYNADNFTTQVSAAPFGDDGAWQPVNNHGTRVIKMSIAETLEDACPRDATGDGRCDAGGCLGKASYASRTNRMTLYELDKRDFDQFVQTLNFDYPSTDDLVVDLDCDVWGCNPEPVQSEWVSPSSHEPRISVRRVTAMFSIRVERAWFDDEDNMCASLRMSDSSYVCY